ncbi:MAG: hypothetical protein RMK29_10140 [Myxococcales bacterium]|nr:hypothetical protein [Myxococcota bacterium]MDW8282062.1 hypothetical protein [Myxococcales bacterium]
MKTNEAPEGPAAGAVACLSAEVIRDRLRRLGELGVAGALPFVPLRDHAQHEPTAGVSSRSADLPEAQRRRRELLVRLRRLALQVAQAAADGIVLLDQELALLSEQARRAAEEIMHDPARPMYERMFLAGLWAPLPATRPAQGRRSSPARRTRPRSPKPSSLVG